MEGFTTAHALDRFFAERSSGSMLSLADAVRQLRPMMPGCELTDDELAELISWHAIRARVDLRFDRGYVSDGCR